MHSLGEDGAARRAGYRRSARSPRGEARRRELLDRVTDDLAANGLVDFSLRRAARAAGTTHKVLLYHFDGADDLLRQAIFQLRDRRIGRGLAAANAEPDRQSLATRVRAVWPILISEEARVLDQAMGLAMYDPDRYVELGRGGSRQYLPALLSICPADWSGRRKLEVAEMILAVLRGFVVDSRTSGDAAGIAAGFDALVRALDREEAVVWARDDRVMPPEHGRRLAELFPDGRLVEIDDSYTLIPLDQPARFAQAIREFIPASG